MVFHTLIGQVLQPLSFSVFVGSGVSLTIECEAAPNRSGLTDVSSFGTLAFND
jgi:hypothetical protein